LCVKQRELLDSLAQVSLRYDVVRIEYSSGEMAWQSHCHALRNTGTDKVPQARTPEVMKKPSRNLGPRTGRSPGCVTIADWLPLAVEHKRDHTLPSRRWTASEWKPARFGRQMDPRVAGDPAQEHHAPPESGCSHDQAVIEVDPAHLGHEHVTHHHVDSSVAGQHLKGGPSRFRLEHGHAVTSRLGPTARSAQAPSTGLDSGP
jgi:hypothetical protein